MPRVDVKQRLHLRRGFAVPIGVALSTAERTPAVADDIVTRLRDITARCWCAEKSQGEPVGKPFFRCESCDDQLQAADEIERLRAERDMLADAVTAQVSPDLSPETARLLLRNAIAELEARYGI